MDWATPGVTVRWRGTMMVRIPGLRNLVCLEPPTFSHPSRSRRAMIFAVFVSCCTMCTYIHIGAEAYNWMCKIVRIILALFATAKLCDTTPVRATGEMMEHHRGARAFDAARLGTPSTSCGSPS
jgi:hypothetical protein